MVPRFTGISTMVTKQNYILKGQWRYV